MALTDCLRGRENVHGGTADATVVTLMHPRHLLSNSDEWRKAPDCVVRCRGAVGACLCAACGVLGYQRVLLKAPLLQPLGCRSGERKINTGVKTAAIVLPRLFVSPTQVVGELRQKWPSGHHHRTPHTSQWVLRGAAYLSNFDFPPHHKRCALQRTAGRPWHYPGRRWKADDG